MSVLTPYIAVADARAAIDWYREVFGATVTVDPIEMPDGRIGHVEFDLHGARLMMADAHPELQCPSPQIGVGSPVTLHLTVTDVDAVVERARGAGGLVDRDPADQPGVGRTAVIRDPFGHRWFFNQPEEPDAHRSSRERGGEESGDGKLRFPYDKPHDESQ